MTWDEACSMMLKGKRVRLPHWNSWITLGFGEKTYLNITTITEGYREFAPEARDMISKLWELAEGEPECNNTSR